MPIIIVIIMRIIFFAWYSTSHVLELILSLVHQSPFHAYLLCLFQSVFDFLFLSEEEPEPKESKRPRLDFGQNIFDQLTSVLEEVTPFSSHISKSEVPVETLNSDGDTTIVHVADSLEEVQLLFAKKNLSNLLQLNGSEILVDVCSHLPLLARYIHRCREAISSTSFVLPLTLSEALTARNR